MNKIKMANKILLLLMLVGQIKVRYLKPQ